jgi:acyl-CoA thioesterase
MSTAPDFVALTTPTRIADGEFTIDIPDGWQQGRGAFGGLVLSCLLRAALACEPEAERTLRSLTAELVGPVMPGAALLRVEVLRRGSGVSTLAARLLQGSELLAHAVVVLGRARAGTTSWNRLSPPAPPPPHAVAPLAQMPIGAARFAQFVEFRPTLPMPFQSETPRVPLAAGWVRLRCAPPVLGPVELVALADAWWPGALAMEAAPRPIATIAFTCELLADPARLRPHAAVFHRAEAVAAQDGYSVELRELWSEDGELLTLNQQTIAIIK